MREYGFSLTRILPYKDRIYDSVFKRKNTGQWKPVSSHILSSVSYLSETFSEDLQNNWSSQKVGQPRRYPIKHWSMDHIKCVEYVKVRVGSASQVHSGQLGNPVLALDFKLGPSWLHFYHASQVDSRDCSLCPVMKQMLIFKISDMVTFTLPNTIITFDKLIFLKFFLWYEAVITLSFLSRTSENYRSNLNRKLAFSKDPVHWVVTFLKNQTFINVFLQSARNIWSNSF